ncbi:ABC-three component system middle component 1 [Labilibaculum euxinus]|uniref:Uncharacterized protein n=1 Tax=Labilibaculum euxinus TaxID=2686357 RepID=A0A7M4DB23_9BACT|nr:ABC-three component system middle component 1 [Labilibaculum euxinus]MUP39852.1 hypothetical protein [Labilibaculum euxinus]MVB09057.1 hypothetical protein [Labilibaculum euxinus]
MNYSVDTLISDLKEEFDNVEFSFEEKRYQGRLPCFFISVESEEELARIWMKVSDIIAVNYQSRMKNEFSIWNLYLFFIVSETISNDLKYQIENDTFSSRKIVIDEKANLTKIVDEHILNSDIKIDDGIINNINFIPSSIIFNHVADIEVKSRLTDAVKKAHSQIIKKIKEESNEIKENRNISI